MLDTDAPTRSPAARWPRSIARRRAGAGPDRDPHAATTRSRPAAAWRCCAATSRPRGALIKHSAATPRADAARRPRRGVRQRSRTWRRASTTTTLDVTPTTCWCCATPGRRARRACRRPATSRSRASSRAPGVKDMVRISDARMSGTAFGTIVLHITPEAAVGGPLALVRTGDRIRLDAEAPPHRPAGGRRGTGRTPRRLDAAGTAAGRGPRLSAAVPRAGAAGRPGLRLRLLRPAKSPLEAAALTRNCCSFSITRLI